MLSQSHDDAPREADRKEHHGDATSEPIREAKTAEQPSGESSTGPEATSSGYSAGIPPVAAHVARDMTARTRASNPDSDVSDSQPATLPSRPRHVDVSQVSSEHAGSRESGLP